MGIYAGPANQFSNRTDSNRIDATTKLAVQSGLVLNLDAGASTSYPPTRRVYSTGWSGSVVNPTNSFDGSLSTRTGQSGTATYTFAGGLSVSGTVRIYVDFGATSVQVSGLPNVIVVDGTDVSPKMAAANLYSGNPGWIDVTSEVGSVFNTIVITGTSNRANPGIWAVEVDGQILVDSATWTDLSAVTISSATGALPIYNTTDTYGAVKGTGTRTDANASSLVLAIPMDGANNGTTFTDESATIKGSGTAKAITVVGNTKTLTAQSKFYGSSGYFDGSGDYLELAASNDFAFGTGDFTVEGFLLRNTLSNSRNIIDCRNGSGGWKVQIEGDGDISFYSEVSLAFPLGSDMFRTETNRWYHFAFVRSSGILYGFIDGNLITFAAHTSNYSTSIPCIIGARYTKNDQYYNGHLQDFRIYKGVAKYTANFTPPGNPNNGTLTNGPTYSNANGGSIVFDGSDDYVNTPNSASLLAVGNGSFTLASWFKLSGTKTWTQNLIRRDNFLVQGGENRRVNALGITANTNYANFGVYDGSNNNATGSQNLNDGLWHYAVGVRDNSTGTQYLYVDGVLKAQAVYASSSFNTSNASYAIGNVSSNYTGEPFFGNIAQASIYNRALSAAEISQNFNALRSRFGI